MSDSDADRWVVISAALVLGIYAYRRLTEPVTTAPTVKNVLGLGNPVKAGAFLTAWGFTFLVVSVIATADAGLGKAFALLIVTADLLSNGQQIAGDVSGKVAATTVSPNMTTRTGPAATVSGVGSPSTPSMFTDPFSGFPILNVDPLQPQVK